MKSHFGLPQPVQRIASLRQPAGRLRAEVFFVTLLGVLLTGLMVAAQEEQPAKAATTKEEPAKEEPVKEESDKEQPAKPGDGQPPSLLDSPKFFEAWEHYSAEEGTKLEDVWRIVQEKVTVERNGQTVEKIDNVLLCTGKPFGYLRSKEIYEDCQFGLEWRFPKDENGNSGILVYGVGKDEIWPKSIQIQFHRPKVGSVFPMKDATCDPQLPGKMLEKPASEWNTCVVTCRGDTISLEINGQDFGVVKGCMPTKGFIALQSEGAEVRFRNFWKRPLK